MGAKHWWEWASIALTVLFLIPIWFFQYLPLNDWPNHLASMYLLIQHNLGSCPYIIPNPAVFLPNSLAFLFLEFLGQFTGVIIAGKLLLSVYVIALPVSLAYFFKAIDKRLEPFSLAAFAFMYNWIFMMGFASNALSLPLFLFACGFWLKIKDEKFDIANALFFAFISLLAFLTHISAFIALFGVMAFMRLWGRKYGREKAMFDAAGIATPAILCALLIFGMGGIGAADSSSAIIWGNPIRKLQYFIAMFQTPPLAMMLFLVLAIFVAISRKIEMKPAMPNANYLIFALLLFIACMLFPEILPNWQFAGARMVPFVLLFAFVFALKSFVIADEAVAGQILAAFAVYAVISLSFSFYAFNEDAAVVQQYAMLSSHMANSSTVFPVGMGSATYGNYFTTPLFHAWGYWVIEKNMFSPYIFSEKYSPVQYLDPSFHGHDEVSSWMEVLAYQVFANESSGKDCGAWKGYYSSVNWSLVSSEYDYVVFRPGACDENATIPLPFKLIANQSGNYVYGKAG